MKEIQIYKMKNGKSPFLNWLNSLDKPDIVRIYKRLNRINDGNLGDCKKLKNSELSEMRLFFGKGYRIYFSEFEEMFILILAGGDKSNQCKTIEQAETYLKDFIERNKKHE